MPMKAYHLSDETVERIARCQSLLASDLGVRRVSKTMVVERAVMEMYKKHQWREEEDASHD